MRSIWARWAHMCHSVPYCPTMDPYWPHNVTHISVSEAKPKSALPLPLPLPIPLPLPLAAAAGRCPWLPPLLRLPHAAARRWLCCPCCCCRSPHIIDHRMLPHASGCAAPCSCHTLLRRLRRMLRRKLVGDCRAPHLGSRLAPHADRTAAEGEGLVKGGGGGRLVNRIF